MTDIVNKHIWDETQSLIEQGISFIVVGSYLTTTFLIGIPVYVVIGVIRKIKPRSDTSTKIRKGGPVDWKKVMFGNPFGKKKGRKSTSSVSLDGIQYGAVAEDPKEKEDPLTVKQFSSRQEASDVYNVELRKIFYKELFYTISIRCPNCRLEGIVRLERGTAADGAECPRCEVQGLGVTGVGSDRSEDILHSPSFDDETESAISEQVQNAVEHAWSVGRIKRGGIFDN